MTDVYLDSAIELNCTSGETYLIAAGANGRVVRESAGVLKTTRVKFTTGISVLRSAKDPAGPRREDKLTLLEAEVPTALLTEVKDG